MSLSLLSLIHRPQIAYSTSKLYFTTMLRSMVTQKNLSVGKGVPVSVFDYDIDKVLSFLIITHSFYPDFLLI